MNKIKIIVWLLAVLIILGSIYLQPQYSEIAVKALLLLLGDEQCFFE